MFSKLAAAAALVASANAAAPLTQDAVTTANQEIASHISRRGLADICFKGCGDNGSKKGLFGLECECNEGFGGNCCRECSVPDIQTVDIDLEEFIRASWYVQRQQENGFQGPEDLYCVVATYSLTGQRVIFNPDEVLDVSNYGNSGGVNVMPMGGIENGGLCGRTTGEPGKLAVAPCFLPDIFAGPYWIAAVGETDGKYDWAVIIGGQPKEFAPDGKCTTSLDDINNSGLWFFSRTPVAPAEQLEAMEAVIEDLGVSGSLLINVPQEGCRYDGALIKENI